MALLVAMVPACILADPTPVVLWHGMGDSCCNPLSMGSIKRLIEENIPDVYVHSVEIGGNVIADTENGFFMNVNKQVQMVCDLLKNDTKFANGYHSVGFSQGGQFLRAVAQRCPEPKMRNLVSVGGQHEGVFGLPRCPAEDWICEDVRKLLDVGAYVDWVQNLLVQAEYWHDSLNEEEYREKSIFIADINNERTINPTYKENLLKLENFLLVLFTEDGMVVPRESEWFGFYTPGQDQVVQNMTQRAIYTEDRIGLKVLNESNRLHFLAVDGDHLQIPSQVFIDEIINKYLKQ